MAKRKSIPDITRHEVLRESGYKCGNPVCRNILTLQLHHIEWVKDGGDNDALNLLPLCGHCHDLHTSGHIPKSAILHWKGILVSLNSGFGREIVDYLLFLSVDGADKIWYTGDGIVRFMGLIAADLVDIWESQYSIGVTYKDRNNELSPPTFPPTTSIRIRLSAKGRMLVDSWKKGDGQLLSDSYEKVTSVERT